jgi:predicted phosphohydrolase
LSPKAYASISTSTKYYSPIQTSSRLYERLYLIRSPSTSSRLYQRLSLILITFNKFKVISEALPNIGHLQQVQGYIRGYAQYWSPSTSSRLYQRLYQILITINKFKFISEAHQILITFNRFKVYKRLLHNIDHLKQVQSYIRGSIGIGLTGK